MGADTLILADPLELELMFSDVQETDVPIQNIKEEEVLPVDGRPGWLAITIGTVAAGSIVMTPFVLEHGHASTDLASVHAKVTTPPVEVIVDNPLPLPSPEEFVAQIQKEEAAKAFVAAADQAAKEQVFSAYLKAGADSEAELAAQIQAASADTHSYVQAPVTQNNYQSNSEPGSYLSCVRQRESGGNYGIVSPDGDGHGAYQFEQPTWNSTAASAGRNDLVGVSPESASPADQDSMAQALYSQQGTQPWQGGNYAC